MSRIYLFMSKFVRGNSMYVSSFCRNDVTHLNLFTCKHNTWKYKIILLYYIIYHCKKYYQHYKIQNIVKPYVFSFMDNSTMGSLFKCKKSTLQVTFHGITHVSAI